MHVAEDRNYADTKLLELVSIQQAVVVQPFNDPFVIAHQGIVMIELLDQVADLDIVLAPVGDESLLSGLSLAAQAPGLRLTSFACESTGTLDAMH